MSDEKTRWEWKTDDRKSSQDQNPWDVSIDSSIHSTGDPPANVSDLTKTKIYTPRRRADEPVDYAGKGKQDPAEDSHASDPVVGWLVVIKGPGRGHSIPLGIGNNPVGREKGQRARLNFGDDMISRANQASIIYDDRERGFFVQHGEGKNLTRVNGRLISSLTPLKPGDRIELSPETMLRFVPFCGADFDWSDDI